jgi:hypothetical protein
MAFNQKDVDWLSKEKREFASKTINSLLINNKDGKVKDYCKIAKEVVDFIFSTYPDQVIIPEGNPVAPTQFKTRSDFNVPQGKQELKK